MKYLKFFENKREDKAINDFLKKMYDYYRVHGYSLPKDTMNYYEFPNDFEDEFNILSYLYTKNWINNDKIENNYTKMKIKNLVKNNIIKKFEKNPNLYDKLSSLIENPNWFGNFTFYKKRKPDCDIIFAFRTALKHSPSWLKNQKDFNL